MTEAKKPQSITFWLTDEEYAQIKKSALATGEDPNSWCRNLALNESHARYGLSRNERIIYQEIARVYYLINHGFRMLANGELAPEVWEQIIAQADRSPERIVDDLLSIPHRVIEVGDE